jgi:hypothetical protein
MVDLCVKRGISLFLWDGSWTREISNYKMIFLVWSWFLAEPLVGMGLSIFLSS